MRTAFASPQVQPLHEHEEHFLDTIDWFIATETNVEPVGNADR